MTYFYEAVISFESDERLNTEAIVDEIENKGCNLDMLKTEVITMDGSKVWSRKKVRRKQND